LDAEAREHIWMICREGVRDLSEIVGEKLSVVLARSALGQPISLRPAHENKLDPVFRAELKDGRICFVKYAGDTVSAGRWGSPLHPKPRRRLGAERRALKRLKDLELDHTLALPEVLLFEKKSLTLVLSEVCPRGTSLLEELQKGDFKTDPVRVVASFLAVCHHLPAPIKPVWGEEESDQAHWQAVLALKTLKAAQDNLPEKVQQDLKALRLESRQAAEKTPGQQLLILDCVPKNILLGNPVILLEKGRVGLIDLESCSSIGDPACDFGLFLGHLILWSLAQDAGLEGEAQIQAALQAYQAQVNEALWQEMSSRVLAFAGVSLLSPLLEKEIPEHWSRLRATGSRLLRAGIAQSDTPEALLCPAASGRPL